MAETGEQGLYAALTVLPTRGLVDYMETLPREMGAKLKPEDAHVSLTYPYEMVVAGAKNIDERTLAEVEAEISDEIDALDLGGETIMPATDRLVPFKRFWVVPIKPSDAIFEAHRAVSRVVKTRFDVEIANWRDDYHMSVRRRPLGKKGRGGKAHHVPFPNGFILNGHRVEVNDVEEIPPHLLCMSRAISAQRDFAAAAP